uniref:Uncharacterized protein n=1 Tax=Anguilla anguilla TaxID=7936 RepID=A0A0E9XRB5_ANGAN
MNLAEFLLTT